MKLSHHHHTAEGILCWIPLLSYLCLVVFTAIAYFKVGHWPLYGRPDPGTLGLPLLYGAALLAYPVTYLAVIIGVVGLALEPEAWHPRQAKRFFVGTFFWALSLGPAIGLVPWLSD